MASLTFHLGQTVYDRTGTAVGRIDQIRRADPLAMGDDGRMLGDAGDLAAVLPGWYVRKLPHLPAQIASDLVHSGYIRIPGGRVGPERAVRRPHRHRRRRRGRSALRVAAPDLPVER